MNKLNPGVAGKTDAVSKRQKGEGAGKVGQFHQLKKKRADRGSTAKGCNVGVEFQQGRERKEVLRWRKEQEIKGGKGE